MFSRDNFSIFFHESNVILEVKSVKESSSLIVYLQSRENADASSEIIKSIMHYEVKELSK